MNASDPYATERKAAIFLAQPFYTRISRIRQTIDLYMQQPTANQEEAGRITLAIIELLKDLKVQNDLLNTQEINLRPTSSTKYAYNANQLRIVAMIQVARIAGESLYVDTNIRGRISVNFSAIVAAIRREAAVKAEAEQRRYQAVNVASLPPALQATRAQAEVEERAAAQALAEAEAEARRAAQALATAAGEAAEIEAIETDLVTVDDRITLVDEQLKMFLDPQLSFSAKVLCMAVLCYTERSTNDSFNLRSLLFARVTLTDVQKINFNKISANLLQLEEKCTQSSLTATQQDKKYYTETITISGHLRAQIDKKIADIPQPVDPFIITGAFYREHHKKYKAIEKLSAISADRAPLAAAASAEELSVSRSRTLPDTSTIPGVSSKSSAGAPGKPQQSTNEASFRDANITSENPHGKDKEPSSFTRWFSSKLPSAYAWCKEHPYITTGLAVGLTLGIIVGTGGFGALIGVPMLSAVGIVGATATIATTVAATVFAAGAVFTTAVVAAFTKGCKKLTSWFGRNATTIPSAAVTDTQKVRKGSDASIASSATRASASPAPNPAASRPSAAPVRATVYSTTTPFATTSSDSKNSNYTQEHSSGYQPFLLTTPIMGGVA